MKIKLLTIIAISFSLCGYAQTKGTNALSLGVNIGTNKLEFGSLSVPVNQEIKNNSYNLGYGVFIKDNSKIGVEFTYSTYGSKTNNITVSNGKSYGGI